MSRKPFLFLLVMLLSFNLVNADTKPVAAEIESNLNLNGVTIDLFVEVDKGDLGQITCMVKNNIEMGTSAFSTNLGNLVYKNFPEVPCNDLWSFGDLMWYEIKQNNAVWTSDKEAIKSGTGLQMLETLRIDEVATPGNIKQPGSSSDDSGGGSDKDLETPAGSKDNEKLMGGVEITIKLDLNKDNIKIINELIFGENNINDFELKHVIYSYPFEEIIKVFVDNDIYLDGGKIIKEYPIADLKPGRYKLRSFVYSLEELVTVSEAAIFNIDGEKLPVAKEKIEKHTAKPVSLEEKTLEKIPLWMLISMTLALMATFLFWSKLLKKN